MKARQDFSEYVQEVQDKIDEQQTARSQLQLRRRPKRGRVSRSRSADEAHSRSPVYLLSSSDEAAARSPPPAPQKKVRRNVVFPAVRNLQVAFGEDEPDLEVAELDRPKRKRHVRTAAIPPPGFLLFVFQMGRSVLPDTEFASLSRLWDGIPHQNSYASREKKLYDQYHHDEFDDDEDDNVDYEE